MQNAPLKVFLSSTTRDFFVYRSRTADAIKQAGLVPLIMEDFPPSAEGVLGVSRQGVRECDIYAILMGFRYGSDAWALDKDGNRVHVHDSGENAYNKSYTELEYDEAMATGKTILAYMPSQQIPTETMIDTYFPGLFNDIAERIRRESAGQPETAMEEKIRAEIERNKSRQSAFIARISSDPAYYVAATYQDPNLLPSKITTDILQGMQGRLPGEMALRQAEVALRSGNVGVAVAQLATSVFYLSGGANQFSTPAPTQRDTSRDVTRRETPAHHPPFMLAIALLRNRPPGSIPSAEIVGIEDNLRRSLRAQPTRTAYGVWAYVKWEHYIRRGMVRPHQFELDEIMRLGAQLPPSEAEIPLQTYILKYFGDLATKLNVFADNPRFQIFKRTLGVVDNGD